MSKFRAINVFSKYFFMIMLPEVLNQVLEYKKKVLSTIDYEDFIKNFMKIFFEDNQLDSNIRSI